MSWGDIDLASVPTTQDVLPEQTFNFEVVSARFNPWDQNKVDLTAKVVDGEFKGRTAFGSYPDPAKFEWSPQLIARLAKNMGIAINKDEDPVTFLTRAATLAGKFSAPIKHRVVEVDGLPETRGEINVMKVKAYKP